MHTHSRDCEIRQHIGSQEPENGNKLGIQLQPESQHCDIDTHIGNQRCTHTPKIVK